MKNLNDRVARAERQAQRTETHERPYAAVRKRCDLLIQAELMNGAREKDAKIVELNQTIADIDNGLHVPEFQAMPPNLSNDEKAKIQAVRIKRTFLKQSSI